MNKKIYLSSPNMGGTEIKYVQEAFDTNWIAPLGPHVNGFEQDLASYTGAKHAAALTTGTGALHLSLILSNVQAGDYVLCSTFTFCASANPITYLGAHPVFIDSEPDTWNMSPEYLRKALVELKAAGKSVKAVVLVHLYGMPSKMDELISICQEFNVVLIEDAAEALGSTYQGQAMGTFGAMGILSFNGNKIITTSGGGALISNDEQLVNQARFLATQARDNAPHYQHSHIGYNYRMSNVCAAIGRGQMEVLNERVRVKRDIHTWYENLLKGIPGISFLQEPEGMFSNRWLTCILIDPSQTKGITRETLRLALEADNIESRPLWKPMHLQPVFANALYFGEGESEKWFENGLCLPSDTNMGEEEMKRVEKVLGEVFGKF